ncbi:unnamed protein product [Ceutorhynchus assimilis]|uniref:Zinc finger PHD-type domain-containing protein n=1 Tax=Ceutorhynchus assimilis TaxID=467358 RepID=A0A9N9QL02_9CUCU|nr:unnamed protein product [Ceutorhynchus assimilis]
MAGGSGKAQTTCGKCGKNIPKSQYSKQCDKCKHWFHLISCTNLNEVDVEVMKKLQNKWFCESCKSRVENEARKSLTASHSQQNTPTAEASDEYNMSSMTEILQQLKELNQEVRDLRNDVKFYADKYDEQLAINTSLSEKIQNMKRDFKKINIELVNLKGKSNLAEKENRKNNVVILGLKNTVNDCKTKPKEVIDKASKVLNFIEPDLALNNVKIKIANNTKENSPIIVSFESFEEKLTFLARRREKGRITSDKCELSGKDPIFINEDMDRDQRELFKEARALRQRGFKFVWARGGNVFVRKIEGSERIKIVSRDDIQNLY